MKKRLHAFLALLLVLTMLCSSFAACKSGIETGSTDTESAVSTESKSPSETDSNGGNEAETDGEIQLTGQNADLIVKANELANGVVPYYSDAERTAVTIENQVMSLNYRIQSKTNNMLVSSLTTPSGNTYIQDTMDIFLKMKNGNTFYASQSAADAKLNIYRYGYYYYENRIEGQNFISSQYVSKELIIDHTAYTSKNCLKALKVNEEGNLTFKTSSTSDPWISFGGISFAAAEYDYLEITMKVEAPKANGELFIIAGSQTSFTANQRKDFALASDEEFHTYRIPLCEYPDYTGSVTALRFDINNGPGGMVEISQIRVIKIDDSQVPSDLSIQRSFLTYSDKLHHLVQFSIAQKVTDIDSIGMITKISADTVDKLIVKDKNGLKETLNDVDWASAEYVGFDIKNAGIFGYILPSDGKSGTLSVTLEEGIYTVTQSMTPPNGEFVPSKNGTRNALDVFMGQRIYNDENHTFDTFIKEAECERHPLTEDNIVVDTRHDSAKFLGYDPLYGFYKFRIDGTGFNQAYYNYPNKQFRVCFTVTGDQYDRQMYFMTRCTSSGSLESAALLDSNNMLLPIPMEVSKNFAGDGENTIYNLDDAAYGEAYFPMIVKAGETREYSALNLYQNWGIFPLKQISSIQFHIPYYHLSTGVTETNCIVPLEACGPGLPDHRAMSAPFWPTQPQHNSGGGHAFLRYNNDNGSYKGSNNTSVSIDSYGPTYCDITLGYETFDGAVSATYTHTEMPQIDENRAFYEMRYVFNEDVSFKNFADQFTFYTVTDNNPKGTYKKVGYLDEENASQVVGAVLTSGQKKEYVLGTECPYFSFFDMPDYDKEYQHAFGYTNLSMLFYNYEIIVNGEKIDANLLLVNTFNTLKLTIDLDEITFKKGDTITFNAILMPWGSQESDYSGAEPDGNVREVRRNTLLNPLKAEAMKDCEVIESVFVPKVKTTNGKSAEFTLKGGNDNVAVRVYGFDTLTVPIIEELIDGKWVEYKVNSISQPDKYDFGYYYDGYMVHYDGDGTYSYSFVATMDNGAPRTFRVTMNEDFKGWPDVEPPISENKEPDPINVYADVEELFQSTINRGDLTKKLTDDSGTFVRWHPSVGAAEAYLTPFSHSINEYVNVGETGQYIVIKYRLPDNIENHGGFEIFTSTENTGAAVGDSFRFNDLVHDGQWQVVIINAAQKLPSTFKADQNGKYAAQYLRFDYYNKKFTSSDMYVDIAYIGLCNSLDKLYELNSDLETVTLIENGKSIIVDTATKQEQKQDQEITYVDPASGYKMNTVPFASWLDYLNGTSLSKGAAFDREINIINYNDTTISGSLITLSGWALMEGGVEQYVWSADGGKTWNEAPLYKKDAFTAATDDFFSAVTTISPSKYEIKDKEASNVNCRFQGSKTGANSAGIVADLSAYEGKTVDLTFAAVSKADPTSLGILIHIKGITVLPPEASAE